MEVTFIGFIEQALRPICHQPFAYEAVQAGGIRKGTLPVVPVIVPEFFLDLRCTDCGNEARMAYGYRDDQFFFLKIRQAYPGDPG